MQGGRKVVAQPIPASTVRMQLAMPAAAILPRRPRLRVCLRACRHLGQGDTRTAHSPSHSLTCAEPQQPSQCTTPNR